MTESEGTTQGGSSTSSGSSSSEGTRKRATGARRKATARKKTTASGRRTASRGASGRRTSGRRRAKATGLESLLNDLAKRANRAGETITSLSEEGATAARRTFGAVTATSKKTIDRVKKEWNQMDNTRRVQFVGALLGALAAAAAGVRKVTKK